MKSEIDHPHLSRLAVDADGLLFDEHTRESAGRGQHARSLEALSAVRAAARQLRLMQERWAETQGLSDGRLQLLFALSHIGDEGISLGRLAALQGVSPRNITGLVDNLERAGLIERVPDADDRRSIHARLTPAGRSRVDAIRTPAMALLVPLTDGFTDGELVQLRHLNLKLLANARKAGVA
jgi:DNA-binding MarR family transcriptional regulator